MKAWEIRKDVMKVRDNIVVVVLAAHFLSASMCLFDTSLPVLRL